ncbi:MAG: tetratricopeptide repeat protein [Leptolyngbya sp. SIO1E4]|nr:tetratricopeptide repeat protein [Leptolyngbya sp. SIO1E4]
MRRLAKLLGLVVVTALAVIAFQSPGFSREPWGLAQPRPDLTKQASELAVISLEVEGILENGDGILADGSLYDAYPLEGQAGQTIAITLESIEFDTFLLVLDAQGNELARNDDIDRDTGNYHSFVTLTLPVNGTCIILANGADVSSRGRYRLVAVEVSPGQAVPALSPAAFVAVEANRLLQQGIQQHNIAQFREALQSFSQALAIYREIGNRQGEANTLGSLGRAYHSLGDYEQAINFQQQSLAIAQEIGDRRREAISLRNLGLTQRILGDYEQAINFHQRALAIAQETGNHGDEAGFLNDLGLVYLLQGDYQRAVDLHQQTLFIAQEIGNHGDEANALGNLGLAYYSLGDYERALDFHQQQLVIVQKMGNLQGEANALGSLGLAYYSLNDYRRTIDVYQQALTIFQEIGDRFGESITLSNLGNVYNSLGNYRQAVDLHQQALAIAEEIGDRQGEAIVLNNLGDSLALLRDDERAIDFYQQSLILAQTIGSQSVTGTVLSNLGHAFSRLEQPELAIVFYKQSVNVRESIRDDLKELPQELQQSFADSVAGSYRALADLLLQQNRILEAQRVLDLLKVQELDEYFQDVQRSAQTETGIDFWQVETDLLALYQQVLDQATELAELEAKPPASRTAAEQQRLADLRAIRDEAEGWFEGFLDDPDVIATVDEIRASTKGQNLEPENFEDLPNNLRQLPQKTAALYPLILEDRLELVLIMPDGPPLRYPIAVSSTELKETIVAFGQALNSPVSNIEPLAQQLYTWLIGPMAQQLDQAGIESLIYAPDGVLRYIPLAALHDGEQYLAQRFSISHVTAASLTDLNLKPQETEGRLLAAACAECSFTVTIADQAFPFADLPFTQTEVEILAEQVDEVDVLLNQAFNPAAMADLPSYRIVHLATHAAFVTGAPEESFIVFGSGDIINLRDIRRDWQLDNAELVVLSACETAVGSAELGSGIEILGLGYQIERAGAQATLASLWKVSDGGTQALMNAFYGALQQADMTKTEALRQAQIALITDDFTAVGGERGTIEIISTETGQPLTGNDLSHPYYWAPFILIGNGL